MVYIHILTCYEYDIESYVSKIMFAANVLYIKTTTRKYWIILKDGKKLAMAICLYLIESRHVDNPAPATDKIISDRLILGL